MLTELTTHAVNYAFPASRQGTMVAQAHRGAPRRVEDDGVGMASFREGSLG